MPTRPSPVLVAVTFLFATAAVTFAQSTTVTVGGNGPFGEISVGAQLTLYTGGCVGSHGNNPFYGTLSVYAPDSPENEVFVGGSGDYQVSTGSTSFVAPGTYQVEGYYSGFSGTDQNGSACSVSSVNATANALVAQGTTYTAIPNLTTPFQSGQSVTLPALITIPQVSGQPSPTGTATLLYGSTTIATQQIATVDTSDGLAGSAIFVASTKGVPSGTYQVTVSYSGDANYLPSTSNLVSIKILPAKLSTSTSLSVSPNPVLAGELTTLDIAVTPTGTTIPTGSVTILADSQAIGSVTLNPSTGTATLSVPAKIAPGTYSVQALYGGDGFNLPSTSAPVSVTVASETATTTALTITPSTVTQGQTTQLTATVTPQIGNVAPTGSVTISANGEALTSLPLHNGSATINVSTSSYPVGAYSVVAKYLGSATDEPSQSTAQTVTIQMATVVNVSASPNPVTQGNVTTLSASVVGSDGLPVSSGSVAFSYSGNSLGSANISGGIASLPLSTNGLAKGSYVIQAAYGGNSNNPPATGSFTLVVQ
jgi:hypothetical protein